MRSNRSLPALVSLRAFEAAARRLSFSLAGEELFVTQSAISHHIQRLEAELGVALFERRTRAVALTAAFDLGSGLLASSGDWFIPLVLYVVFVQLIIRKNPALRAEEGT